ncbi:MAG: trigger factor [Candidatus Nealsonbacteria bacterium CG_4_10_14_0_8_um_filter_37_14]|uniref:Trigger factor n=1 Tax=Candidatus Nealsonbacteria bacterium CG_4_10_14_0_8_um_filter_37_14 TaxID=1974684 RepID=A0A2M7R5N5_9BACT|nr:MAG: trigger factor [Candidatus Nealsonbacteria bacterium CG11_big_fil_rev_8_21_14_0_20_37_68]PIY88721.1 MAG: trigger factor [Candidatus Nealsonbacteria bacterium CG_4_10_14_0_8_um_filter_37_14]
MQFSIQKLPKLKVEIKIEVPAEEFGDFYQKAVLDLGKDLEMPGFRKGKVPKEIVEKTISQEKILSETAEIAVKESYIKAISQLIKSDRIEPLGQPEIEILPPTTLKNDNKGETELKQEKTSFVDGGQFQSGGGLTFKAVVQVLPEINLPDYKEIASKVKRKKPEVSDKDTQDALKWLQKSRAKFTLKNTPAQKGDWVEIEYNLQSIENSSRWIKDAFVLGEGHFVPGFEENLIGMKAGEEKEFQLSVKGQPIRDGFPEKLREAIPEVPQIKVKLKSIQKMELPELNDEFARNLGQFENLTALTQSVQAGLKLEKENQETQRVRQEILEKIAQKTEMEIPEILIEEQKKKFLENLKKEVSQNLQISFEDYLKKIRKSETEIFESFQEPAKTQIKNSLILREIQKRENILVGKEELNEEVNKILKSFSSPEEAQKKFDPEQLKSYTKEVIRQEKTFQLLEQF